MMHAPSPSPHTSFSSNQPPSSGAKLVSTSGRILPLVGTSLAVDARAGIARVTLEQRFKNEHAEPLAVTYSLPLPADGAVSGFAFTIGDRRVVGAVDRRKAARERYEEALLQGKTAALLEQDRSSVFTQELGNVPPGAEVTIEVAVDQRLRWLDEGAWEWRFPTVVGPRYMGEPGRVADAARVTQDVSDGPLAARVSLTCSIRDAIPEGKRPESPSHAIESTAANGGVRVALREKGARLDRDVVVRWAVATRRVGLSLDVGRAPADRIVSSRAHGLLTIVPPSIEARTNAVPRDLIVLLDTSGSMSGEPLSHAVRVTSALVESLRDRDRLELIEFSNDARRWKREPVAATEAARREALAWLRALRASGGTEMRTGILEALSGLRDEAQRQVVLITDGMIGFESEVVAAIRDRLPSGSRLHTVGVGSAVNRSLTGPAARAGHGVEVVVGIGEDAERAAARIVARTNAPLLVDLTLEGSALEAHAPERLPDLFGGAPALVALALRPEGGEIMVRARTVDGTWEQRLRADAIAPGEGNAAVVALFGRESVEDLEMHLGAGAKARDVDPTIERLGLDYQIATRLTSWIAVSDEATVDPGDPLRRERMPHELPYGMSPGIAIAGGPPMPAMAAPAMMRKVAAREDDGRTRAFPPPAAPGGPPSPRYPSTGAPPAPVAQAPRREAELDELSASAPSMAAPAPAAPAPAARGRSVFGAIKDFFSGAFGGGDAEADEPARIAPAPGEPQVRRLRGRIAVQNEERIVIEVSADGAPIAWMPGATAEITLADGRVVVASFDRTRSTKEGTVAGGATARLALDLPKGVSLDVVRSIRIDLGGQMVMIEV